MSRIIHILLIFFIIVILFFLGVIFYIFTANMFISQVRSQGKNDIMQIYNDIVINLPKVDFQQITVMQAEIISAHIVIVNEEYYLLSDSHKSFEDISGKYITSDLSEAKQLSSAFSVIRGSKIRNLTITVAEKKTISSGEIIIQIIYRIDYLKNLLFSFLFLLIFVSVLLFLLVYLFVLLFIKRYQQPIRKLLQSTRTIAVGGYSKITVDTSSVELSQLVENFNTLIDRNNLLIESDNKKYSRINTLLANMRAGILIVDTRNIITLVNPQAEKLLNINKSRLFRDRDVSVYKNGIIVRVLSETKIVNNQRHHRNITLTTPRGEILDISIQAVFNKYTPYEHSGALVFLQDVTEIRHLEKLKDEFVSNVSHEFRTPLTIISGFIETLKTWNLLTNEDRNTAVNIIELETERLKKLISELMFLSRIEGDMNSISRGSIDPSELAGEVFQTLRPMCEKKSLGIQLNIQEGLKMVYGMTSWFRQILFNLYDNAIKYTPENGSVSIHMYEEKNSLFIDVKDSGPGIPLAEREKIFERFYRGDRSGKSGSPGIGLGLSITRQMVAEFKGSIKVLDNNIKGTIFRVEIPIDTQEE